MDLQDQKKRRISAFSGFFSMVMVLAILIALNLIVQKNDVTKDFTSNQRFSVSDQTSKVLQNLDEPVFAYCFYREINQSYELVKDLLASYKKESSNFDFRFVDLDREPMLDNKFDITLYETIVLEQGDRFLKVMEPTEHAMTNTLIRLTRGKTKKKIYFTRGNGELDIESMESSGTAILRMALNDANYDTESINLMSVSAVPDDCRILAILGPINDPPDEVIQILEQYLNDGGRLFIALEPGSGLKFRRFLTNIGLVVGNNVVLDPNGFQIPFRPIVEDFHEHVITSDFDFGLVFHVASSVRATPNQHQGWISAELGVTGADAWLETDLENLESNTGEFDPQKHQRQSVPIIAVAEQVDDIQDSETAKGRVIAVGDSDFISNIFLQTLAAHEPFAMNVFHWLADEKELIAIPPRRQISQPLLLNKSQITLGILITVFILPLFMALLGTIRLLSRRRSG